MIKNRIDRCFAELKSQGKKAFVAYLSAGDPHLQWTPELVRALVRAGADVIELGIPFSDPLADGPVNQKAAQRALEAGTTLEGIFDAVRLLRQDCDIPLLFFSYLNPIFSFGIEKFVATCEEVGVDGVLLLDLPPEEESKMFPQPTELKKICLIAPTTPEARLEKMAKQGSGFFYYVSREGVTGMQSQLSQSVAPRLALIRKYSELPICVGFGISNPAQAKQAAQEADGVVIGSALVHSMGQWVEQGKEIAELPAHLEALARPLAEAIHSV